MIFIKLINFSQVITQIFLGHDRDPVVTPNTLN
jgi:hypothetical protein